MKLVLDTNVLASGFAARGLCSSLMEICFRNHQVYFSVQFLDELRRALRGSLGVPQELVEEALTMIRSRGLGLEPLDIPAKACRDKNDLHVLGLAAAAKARFLITGDKDLLVLNHFRRTRIVSPRQAWPTLSR